MTIEKELFQKIKCEGEGLTNVHVGKNIQNFTCFRALYSRVKLKKFYSLKQSVLIHLLSKILAFSAFVAFKGLKRPKKAKKKLLPEDSELPNLARNQIKFFFLNKNFLGL